MIVPLRMYVAPSQSYPVKSCKPYFSMENRGCWVVTLYFKLGGQVGSEPFSPTRTAQVDGDSRSESAQSLGALGPGAGMPPGRNELVPSPESVSWRGAICPVCWGSPAQEETLRSPRHPSPAVQPLCDLSWGRQVSSLQGAEPVSSEGREQPQSAGDFITTEPGGPGWRHYWDLGSCLSSCGCKHANIWSPQAFVQRSGLRGMKHLACPKDSRPPLQILSFF